MSPDALTVIDNVGTEGGHVYVMSAERGDVAGASPGNSDAFIFLRFFFAFF